MGSFLFLKAIDFLMKKSHHVVLIVHQDNMDTKMSHCTEFVENYKFVTQSPIFLTIAEIGGFDN